MTPDQFYRATKEIIDRCVAPDMYPMAMNMLKAASKAAVLSETVRAGHADQHQANSAKSAWHRDMPSYISPSQASQNAQMAEIGKAKEDK